MLAIQACYALLLSLYFGSSMLAVVLPVLWLVLLSLGSVRGYCDRQEARRTYGRLSS